MLKNNFKLIIPAVFGAVLGAALIISPVFAQTNALGSDHGKGKTCTVYSDKASKAAANAAAKQIKIDAARVRALAKLNDGRATVDQKMANGRLSADQKRAQAMAKLMAKASTTDAQKAAITAYQTAINKAVTDRRAAIDAALAAYRTAVDQALASRKSGIDQATSTYQAAVTAAYAKALADCQANVDQKTVRANLNAALQAAKKAFDANYQSIGKLQTIISPLIKTRQQAIAAAEANFKTAVMNATTALKAAFPTKTKTTK